MTQGAHVSASARADAIMFGSTVWPDGTVGFRFWAPSTAKVELCIFDDGEKIMVPMQSSPDGWHTTITDKARAGSLYQYRVDGDMLVPDPASRHQSEDVHGPSVVIDSSEYVWQCSSWKGLPWEESIIYELHVGTFTAAGTFAALKSKLDYLKDLGVTAIELMPVADFPGKRSWGYDGVLLFAPDTAYGTPDQLKHLIDAAHEKGMMVFLDVVYNHFGPEGNYLHVYAKQFFNDKHQTPWGAAINFDGAHSDIVRQFFVSNALYWLNEFRFDGLRFDAVHAIVDHSKVHILEEIAQATKDGPAKERQIHLILENDDNIADWLETDSAGVPKLYRAQWNDDVHHAMHVIATNETSGYYCDYAKASLARDAVGHLGRCLTEGFAYQCDPSPYRQHETRGQPSRHLPPVSFISFIQNHDQIGNRAFGERLSTLSQRDAVQAIAAVYLLSPNIPMIFMGEEWGSQTPFLYFCDLGAELAPLVTAGRRKEFAKFAQFQDPKKRDAIPDPIDPQTFDRSKLVWSDLKRAQHTHALQYYRDLLKVRRQQIVPLLKADAAPTALMIRQSGLLICQWRWHGAGAAELRLIANLSNADLPSVEFKELIGTSAIFETSHGALSRLSQGEVPAWTVIWAIKQ